VARGKKNEQEVISFEEALSQLEAIVKHLEKGDASLDESLAKFSEGVKLSQMCLAKLNFAEQEIDRIISEQNGRLVEKPLPFPEGE